MTGTRSLVADIGATNARFGLLDLNWAACFIPAPSLAPVTRRWKKRRARIWSRPSRTRTLLKAPSPSPARLPAIC